MESDSNASLRTAAVQPVRTAAPAHAAALLALVLNALIWGLSWWPFRLLEGVGLHPLWATAAIYGLAVAVISALRPAVWRELVRSRALWVLVLASGTTNAAFNWGVTIGDVVRVVLLFYLMPLWAALLARVLLGEALTLLVALRLVMGLAGAAVVLWPAQGGWPLPSSLADALGLLGGFTFALNTVMLRRQANQPAANRAAAMFLGGTVVAGGLAGLLTWQGNVPVPPAPAVGWVAGVLAMGCAFLLSNWALQYGASRLRANATAVVMLTEVLFASASAVMLGAGAVNARLLLGGGLILGAAMLSSLRE